MITCNIFSKGLLSVDMLTLNWEVAVPCNKMAISIYCLRQSIFLTHPWSIRSSSYKHQGFHFATSLPSQKRGECWIGHTERMRKQKYWRWVGFRIRIYHVALGIVLTPLVVKSMGEFMTHHHSHRAWRFSYQSKFTFAWYNVFNQWNRWWLLVGWIWTFPFYESMNLTKVEAGRPCHAEEGSLQDSSREGDLSQIVCERDAFTCCGCCILKTWLLRGV